MLGVLYTDFVASIPVLLQWGARSRQIRINSRRRRSGNTRQARCQAKLQLVRGLAVVAVQQGALRRSGNPAGTWLGRVHCQVPSEIPQILTKDCVHSANDCRDWKRDWRQGQGNDPEQSAC